MMFYFQPRTCLVVLIQFLLLNTLAISISVEVKFDNFEKEKGKVEEKINSMRLGNYLRKLMMRVSFIVYN
jgi:hypothetical protein